MILAHLDRNPDAGEHAETAAAGAWLQFDGPGRTKYWPDSTILALIGGLAERGNAGRMLLGGDTGRASMMRAYGGGPGLDYLFAPARARARHRPGGAAPRAQPRTGVRVQSAGLEARRAALEARTIVTSSSDVNGRHGPGSHVVPWHMGHAGGSPRIEIP